ncbi:hypothetical protein Tco_1130304 [Tanacetum coccineum]
MNITDLLKHADKKSEEHDDEEESEEEEDIEHNEDDMDVDEQEGEDYRSRSSLLKRPPRSSEISYIGFINDTAYKASHEALPFKASLEVPAQSAIATSIFNVSRGLTRKPNDANITKTSTSIFGDFTPTTTSIPSSSTQYPPPDHDLFTYHWSISPMGGALVLESIDPEIGGRVSARLTPGGVPLGQESCRSYSLRGGQWLVPKGTRDQSVPANLHLLWNDLFTYEDLTATKQDFGSTAVQ